MESHNDGQERETNMISFFLTLKRFLTGLIHSFKKQSFRTIFFLISLTLLSGTIFYTKEEGLSIIDALYFCIATLSTVGHPTFEPQTDLGKIFTMVYIVVGTGLFLALIAHIAYGVFNSRNKDSDGIEKDGNSIKNGIEKFIKNKEA